MSGTVRPTGETGSSGSCADCAIAIAYGRFFATSWLISVSSSGKLEAAAAVRRIPGVVRVGGRDRLARGHLRRLGQRPEAVLHVPVGVAVGRVELGAELRDVPRHGRLVGIPEDRLVDEVVRARGERLPADAMQQQLGGGVPVDRELRPDPGVEADLGLRLRLGSRGRTAVGLAGRVRGRALVVVAPLVGEVAVEVDAVLGGDLPVAVVVAQVLAPQPVALGEREVVAVRVDHRQEMRSPVSANTCLLCLAPGTS
jgi:hypothetical protein